MDENKKDLKVSETIDNVTQHVSKFNRLWKEWAVFAGILVLISGVLLGGINYIVRAQFQAHMKEGELGAVLTLLDAKDQEQDARLYSHDEYISAQIEKNILKQYDKIKKGNFEDIKKEDLEDALRDFPKLKNPAPNTIRAFEEIEKYYRNTY